jgi:hypothetical protein
VRPAAKRVLRHSHAIERKNSVKIKAAFHSSALPSRSPAC